MGKKIWEFTALTDEELDDTAELLGARGRVTKKVPVSLFLKRISAVAESITEVANRVNTIITGGSAEKDAELVDIRAGAFDIVYDSAGDAVRDAQRSAKGASDEAKSAALAAEEAKQLAQQAQSKHYTYQLPTNYGSWGITYGGYWRHGNEVHVSMTFTKKSGSISNGLNTPTSGQSGSSYKEKAFTGFPKPAETATATGSHITGTSSVTLAVVSVTTDGTFYIGVPGASSANAAYSNYINFSYLCAEEPEEETA